MKDSLRRHTVRIALVFALVLAPIYAQQPLNPPLKNWPAPLYWAPTPAEAEQQRLEQRIAHPDAYSAAQAAGIFTPPGPMTFIAMTPCRVMDTRSTQPFTGAFGPPSLAANVTRSVPMPSSACSIPSNAGAYSLNITAVPPGPLSFLSVWPAGQPYPNVSTLNDPVSGGVIANAAIVVAGTGGAILLYPSNITDVIIDINGYYAAPTDLNSNTGVGTETLVSNTSGVVNTALGVNALQDNTTGNNNTAVGGGALLSNTAGSDNTAIGRGALFNNATGSFNTASGGGALQLNTTGSQNTASGLAALQNNTSGNNNTASGYSAVYASTTGSNNTGIGANALFSNTTADNNTAVGYNALTTNTTGTDNMASGEGALQNNTTGNFNTALGQGALYSNTTGGSNTATGDNALTYNTTGVDNTATGYYAMYYNTAGNFNTACGLYALVNNTTGSNNTAIGYTAAENVSAGNSNNIHVGSQGAVADSGVIRIGTPGTQTTTFIAGISGATPGTPNLLVCVDGNGQLGTTGCGSTPSSRRFKEQITDMGDSSSKLLQLRPVTFLYKPQYDDGSHSLQYGLIAEEVAKLYPDMVGYDKDGQPSSVKYQALAPMLLNEVQKQNAQIQSLEDRLAALEGLLSGRQ